MTSAVAVERLAVAAASLLNRLVLVGPDTCGELLAPQPAVRRPVTSVVRALSTVPMERLSSELQDAGYRRVKRGRGTDLWVHGTGDHSLLVESAHTPDGEPADDLAREYAVLLTRSLAMSAGRSIRVAVPAAQVALWWRAHLRSGRAIGDSPAAEEMMELVARSPTIASDARPLPLELRRVLAAACDGFVRAPSARWAVMRVLADARTTPGISDLVLERFLELGGVAA